MAIANQYAREMQYPKVRPEHLLLAILRRPEDGLASIFDALRTHRPKLEADLRRQIPPPVGAGGVGKLGNETETEKVLRLAEEEAQQARRGYVATEHILLGLLRQPESVAARVLLAGSILASAVRDLESQIPEPVDPSKPPSAEQLEAHRREAEEELRWRQLDQMLGRWRLARDIEEFVAEMRGVVDESTAAAGPVTPAWLDWAFEKAKELRRLPDLVPAGERSGATPSARS